MWIMNSAPEDEGATLILVPSAMSRNPVQLLGNAVK